MPRQYRTLGELRSDMRAMLGAAASGSRAGPNASLIDLHLRNAQTSIYNAAEFAYLRRYEDKTIGMHAYLIDYPTTANPDRIKAVSILRGTVWSPPLPRGITPQMYTTQSSYSFPQRWEAYAQMEFWPKADQAYTARIFFIKALDRFTQDADRATVDDTAISLVATATLKGHYRHPDAATHQAMADALIINLKSQAWSKSVFRPEDYEYEPLIKPQTV